ncbi:DUF1643 domain-containing protein [Spiribacter sp. 2438]|nr:DUF1643 domain-containing protein [Spiribacter sp. 2438]
MKRDAQLSACGAYRYHLLRRWAPDGQVLLCILLNPSTADGLLCARGNYGQLNDRGDRVREILSRH